MKKLLTRLLDLLGLCPAAQMDNKVQELDLANQEINRLEYELQTIKSKLLVLSKGPDTQKREFAGILAQSNEELSASSRYSVYEAKDGSHWETVTEYCCLGGCEMGFYGFPTMRDALVFGALLHVIGYVPPSNIACSNCYNEYMKDCI